MRIPLPPFFNGYVPGTSFTVYTGDIGNTFRMLGSSTGSYPKGVLQEGVNQDRLRVLTACASQYFIQEYRDPAPEQE